MTSHKSSSTAQLQQLIEQAKVLRPVSQAARSRVLKRAQASVLAGAAALIAKPAVPLKGSWPRSWLAGAGSATLLVGAAAVALHGGERPTSTHDGSPVTSSVVMPSPPIEPAVTASAPLQEPDQAPLTPTATRKVQRGAARTSESYAAELELLHRANSAYGNGDLANALRLLTEHGRRFPGGRLAEEREALRVRALRRSGQGESARSAARAFAVRFPNSVLLSRTMAAADAGE